jgi:hypothetical protein
MATIERRMSQGQTVYYAKVRRKGFAPQSAPFHKLSDAKKWVQTTEAAILEGRYFPSAEAKRHTLEDLIDRYITDILPQKRPSTTAASAGAMRHGRSTRPRCVERRTATSVCAGSCGLSCPRCRAVLAPSALPHPAPACPPAPEGNTAWAQLNSAESTLSQVARNRRQYPEGRS